MPASLFENVNVILVTFADGIFWRGLVNQLDIIWKQKNADRVIQKKIKL